MTFYDVNLLYVLYCFLSLLVWQWAKKEIILIFPESQA